MSTRLRRGRAEVVLYVVALVLACACVSGGVVIWQQHRSDVRAEREVPDTLPPTSAEADRYGDVKRAAEATALSLLNIDYQDPQASFDAVAETATGTFLKQYEASSSSLVDLVKQYHSVQVGEVDTSAVSSVDAADANVLVAASTTVTNLQTGPDGQARVYRMLVKLVRDGDTWLTNDLEFVG
ncbi:hypothetical protein BH11ACT8_BH11ACT8_05740 [soil metagenome]